MWEGLEDWASSLVQAVAEKRPLTLASRLDPIASRLDPIASRLEAIASRLEMLEAIAIKLCIKSSTQTRPWTLIYGGFGPSSLEGFGVSTPYWFRPRAVWSVWVQNLSIFV